MQARIRPLPEMQIGNCLLYTSDAADERSSVDLGGRRIIKKKNNIKYIGSTVYKIKISYIVIYKWKK